ncbi:MAG: MFS transporter [Sphingomonadales bacterium]|nr:MAG: MFS transporter [Sphingomonadales bacterium]
MAETTQLARSPLTIPAFRDLWMANMLSNFGSQIQTVAAAWLMASMTSSAQLIALVQTSVALPIVFFILVGGALADMLDRRLMMLVSQLFMLATATALAWLTLAGLMTPLLLLMFTFLISAGGSLNNPAWHGSVRDIVPRASISRAVGLNSTSINLARTLGPAIGGAIVGLAGVAVAFFVNAVSYLSLIIALLRWKPAPRASAIPRERLLNAMATGIRYAMMAPPIRAVLMRGAISGFSASAAFALMPVVARQLGGGPFLLGILLGAFGLGAIVGATASGRLRETRPAETLVRAAVVALGGGLALLGATSFMPVAAIGAACCGLGWVLAHSSFNATVQLAAPHWVSSRALALYQTATFGAMAAGSWFFGMIAENAGVSSALFAAAALQILGGAFAFRLRLPVAETLNLEPLGRWSPPQLDIEVADADGPLVVQIEYRIAEADVAEFRTAMTERERIRRRDGARGWTLWRDLHDRSLWIESYRVRDWADYVRHNMRRTQEDVSNVDALIRLHSGPDQPLIRRYLRAGTD